MGLLTLSEFNERVFGRFFFKLGRFNANNPCLVVFLSLMVFCYLAGGLLKMEDNKVIEPDDLWGPKGSIAFEHRDILRSNFAEFDLDARFMIIPSKLDTALDLEYLDATFAIDMKVRQIEVVVDDKTYTHEDLCARSSEDSDCLVASPWAYVSYNTTCLHVPGSCTFPTIQAVMSYVNTAQENPLCFGTECVLNSRFVAGNQKTNDAGAVVSAQALLTTFFMKNEKSLESATKEWMLKYNDVLNSEETQKMIPAGAELKYYSSESTGSELEIALQSSQTLIPISILLTFIFLVFSLSQKCNGIESGMMLSVVALFCILLAVASGIGVAMILGVWYTSITSTVFFLSMGIGMANTILMYSTWNEIAPTATDVVDLNSRAMERVGVFITLTTATTCLAFIAGANTVFPAVQNFCLSAAPVMFFSYCLTLTCFDAVLVLNHKRIAARKADCLCCVTCGSPAAVAHPEVSELATVPDANETPEKPEKKKRLTYRIASILMLKPIRILLILLFLIFLGVSLYLVFVKLEEGLSTEEIVPDGSYVSEFSDLIGQYFSDLGVLVAVVTKDIDYYKLYKTKIQELTNDLKAGKFTADQFYLSSVWKEMVAFENYLTGLALYDEALDTDTLFYARLKQLLELNPGLKKSVVWNADESRLAYAKIEYRHMATSSSTQETDAMVEAREIVDSYDSTLSDPFAYSDKYIYTEMYLLIIEEAVSNLVLSAICVLFVFMMFIHPGVSIMVVFIVGMIDIGLLAWIVIVGQRLNGVTSVCLTMSCGFAADYLSHMSHAFLTASGTRVERAVQAIDEMAIPIIGGAVATFLGVLMLAFANNALTRIFFQMVSGTVLIGVLHGILFLPCVLSFVGPLQTVHDSSSAMTPSLKQQQSKAPPPAISMETIDSNGRVQTPEPITPESQDQA